MKVIPVSCERPLIFPKVMEQKRMRVQSTCRNKKKLIPRFVPGGGGGVLWYVNDRGQWGAGDMRPNFMYPKKDPLG